MGGGRGRIDNGYEGGRMWISDKEGATEWAGWHEAVYQDR